MTSVCRAFLLASLLPLLAGVGCHSAMVDATIKNGTPGELRLIEVQYPSASFGVQILAPGAEFHYRFKILGNGALVITYTDSKQVEHTVRGPDLQEGQEGKLGVRISNAGVRWDPLPALQKP